MITAAHCVMKTNAETTHNDTEAGMLLGISQKHNVCSSPCRLTEFCNSQCLSHFAAPFIVARTETSIAKSCELFIAYPIDWMWKQILICSTLRQWVWTSMFNISSNPSPVSICKGTHASIPKQTSQKNPQSVVCACANDPSAGSPTETLLRLLLPLSDKVH